MTHRVSSNLMFRRTRQFDVSSVQGGHEADRAWPRVAVGHIGLSSNRLAATRRGHLEVRGGPRHCVHSKVMAWVAFDRAAHELEAQAFNEPGQRWREIADEIHAEVCERGFDRDLNSFVQAYGSKRLDASLLLIPLVGFLPASDPRAGGHFRRSRTSC